MASKADFRSCPDCLPTGDCDDYDDDSDGNVDEDDDDDDSDDDGGCRPNRE